MIFDTLSTFVHFFFSDFTSGNLILVASVTAFLYSEFTKERPPSTKSIPLTPRDLIKFANHTYDPSSSYTPHLGFKHIAQENDHGGHIDIFYSSKCEKLIVAVRGTDTSAFADLCEDAKLLSARIRNIVWPYSDGSGKGYGYGNGEGFHSRYVKEILSVMKYYEQKYPESELHLTGHSLGASCCEAAWTVDLFCKISAIPKQDRDWERTQKLRLWSCTTWESPGFQVSPKFLETLNEYPDLVSKHVTHYLAAPNLINCLFTHISPTRRFRVFLKDPRYEDFNMRHASWCAVRTAQVVLNWSMLMKGCASGVAYFFETSAAQQTAATAAEAAVVEHSWYNPMWLVDKFRSTPTISPEKIANAQLLKYAATFRDIEMAITKFTGSKILQNFFPLPAALATTSGNVLLSNLTAGVGDIWNYVLHQHELLHHISAFDVKTGYPKKWAVMESWPTFEEMCAKSFWNKTKQAFIPPSLSTVGRPFREIESYVQNLNGYKEKCTHKATRYALHQHYNRIGQAVFNDFKGRSIPCEEIKCRNYYRNVLRIEPPPPLFVISRNA